QHFADDFAVAERQLAPLGTGRGVRAQLPDREGAVLEDPQHLGADHAGRTHQPDAHVAAREGTHARTSRSSSNDAWSACTARSTSSSATTHEMRIVEVLIISML